MPLNYNLTDPDAPLHGLDIHQTDIMRLHVAGSDRMLGVKVTLSSVASNRVKMAL